MPDQPTLGELKRAFDQLRDDVRDDFAAIREEVKSLRNEVATRETLDAVERGLEKAWQLRLSALESQVKSWLDAVKETSVQNQKRTDRIEKWAGIIVLLIVGPVVAALVGLVLVTGGGGR